MEGVDGLPEVGVDLRLLVRGLLGVRGVGREDGNNLHQEAVDNTSHLTDCSGNAEFGLLVENNQDGRRFADGIHELEETLHKLGWLK